jgi:hypothetical protein
MFSELVLKRNQMDLSDALIKNTRQLLPFLVGIFTFILTVWSVITDKEERGNENRNGDGVREFVEILLSSQ